MEVHTSFVKIPKAERDSIYLLMTGFCGLSGTALIAKKKGDELMAIGETTGVVEFRADDIRVNFESVELAPKGVRCSVAVDASDSPDGKLRRGDKVYIWEEV